ncbi:GINS complex subunit 1 [Tieghemostelium lacteum]|uniref:DNA replication complex GINS protein PSF1 n=1 Tax=Tieghemostelium lacteum TaxID=361077 RepID=A0A151ZHC9_TIELA|nr:GINS complex subunit 1 [Tieghemostelium lacteum]|eukprot:KYQ93315.1 GINS complex subunit 1 [Tieghemostelium lacteum]
MFTEKAIEILKELKRSETIPPYNSTTISKTIEEICALYTEYYETVTENKTLKTTPYFLAHTYVFHSSAARNKRCILAYLMERSKRIREFRWNSGGGLLSVNLKENMSQDELDYFNDYDKLLNEYHTNVGLDLTIDTEQPPKELFIEVRVLKELGQVVLNSGGTVNLHLNTTHFLRRSDVGGLISQGVLEHII